MFWFLSDLGFLFSKKKITYICFSFCSHLPFCLLLTCLFHRSFFLLHSFSAFKYHISYIFNFLFLFSLGSIAHCLSTFPLIYIFFVLPFCFIPSSFLFFLIRSCDLMSFDLIWFEIFCQFLVPLDLSFLFSSFLVVGCRQLMTWSGYLLHFSRQLEL